LVLLALLAHAGCRAPASDGGAPLAWPAKSFAGVFGTSNPDRANRVRRLPHVEEPLAPAPPRDVQLVGYEEENRVAFAVDEADSQAPPVTLASAADAEPLPSPPPADSQLALPDLEAIAL